MTQRDALLMIRAIIADEELTQALTERLADASAELSPTGPHRPFEEILERAIENCPP